MENNDNKQKRTQKPFDAFAGGIENGGLRSKDEIDILICYIVANAQHKVTKKNIVDTIQKGEIANYFEVCDSIAKQIDLKNVIENEDGALIVTDKCRTMVDLIENDLPYTIRERSIEFSRLLARQEILCGENKVEVEKIDDANYKVTMHISDKVNDFMTLSLFVPSSAQADMIKEKFRINPVRVYDQLINSLFTQSEE